MDCKAGGMGRGGGQGSVKHCGDAGVGQKEEQFPGALMVFVAQLYFLLPPSTFYVTTTYCNDNIL